MKDRILNCIRESVKVKESILNSQEIVSNIQNIVGHSVDVFKRGGKILLVETEEVLLMSLYCSRVKWSILQGKKTFVC